MGGVTVAEAQYSTAKVSVWWDIENCPVGKSDAQTIAKNIHSSLVMIGYRGPITIAAYGNSKLIDDSVHQALSSTGITFANVPPGKDASDKRILVDMLLWAVDNAAPANFLLISGDRDFSNALHLLSQRNYNILLAQPPDAAAPLAIAASSVWLWTSMRTGGPPLPKSDSSFKSESSNNSLSESTSVSKPIDMPPNIGKGSESKKEKKRNGKKKSQSSMSETDVVPEIHSDLSKPTLLKPADTCEKQHTYANSSSQPMRPIKISSKPTYQISTAQPMRPNNVSSKPTYQIVTSQPMRPNNISYPPTFSSPIRPINFRYPPTNFNQSKQQMRSNNLSTNPIYPRQFSQPIRPDNFSHPHSFQPCNLPTPDPRTHASNSVYPRDERPYNLGIPRYEADKRSNYSFPSPNHQNATQAHNLQDKKSVYSGNSTGRDLLPSEHACGLVDVVLVASKALKREKIWPTEENIADCIRYGDLKNSNFDVKKALDIAIKQQVVVKDHYYYVEKNENVWKWDCVIPLMGNPNKYPKAKWDEIKKFLASSIGQSAILASHCRYEAAYIMKTMCLKDLFLGDIIQILHMVESKKKWITHPSSEWQPLNITLPVSSPCLGSVPGKMTK